MAKDIKVTLLETRPIDTETRHCNAVCENEPTSAVTIRLGNLCVYLELCEACKVKLFNEVTN